jgi:hypothetical protein
LFRGLVGSEMCIRDRLWYLYLLAFGLVFKKWLMVYKYPDAVFSVQFCFK